MCVCDIAFLSKMTQSVIFHQLIILKWHGLVKSRKEGKIVFYSLNDEHIKLIFGQGLIHINNLILQRRYNNVKEGINFKRSELS